MKFFYRNKPQAKDIANMRNYRISKAIFVAILSTLFFVAALPGMSIAEKGVAGKQEMKQKEIQQKNPYAKAPIITKIIPSENNTFGYDILVNGKTLVHQPSIPAMPGNSGFSTRAKAQKVAIFVVTKIRKNEMPPTVTVEDLNRMGVLK